MSDCKSLSQPCNFYISKEPHGSIQRSGKQLHTFVLVPNTSLNSTHAWSLVTVVPDYFASCDLFKFVPGRSGLQWRLVETFRRSKHLHATMEKRVAATVIGGGQDNKMYLTHRASQHTLTNAYRQYWPRSAGREQLTYGQLSKPRTRIVRLCLNTSNYS